MRAFFLSSNIERALKMLRRLFMLPKSMHHMGFWYWLPHIVDVDEQPSVPDVHELLQNHPNPFNPVTTIRYAVPKTAHVVIRLYDVCGRAVDTLVDEEQAPGYYSFDYNARDLGSGVYFYRMVAGDFRDTKKLVLLK